MDSWRNFFESSGQDIWTVIEKAIGVAAADFPQELRLRRDGFTERLYTAHLLHRQDHEDDVHPRASDKTNAASGVYHRDEEQEEGNNDEPCLRLDSDEGAREMVRDRPVDVRDNDLFAALDEWDQEGMYVKEILAVKDNIRDIEQSESTVMEQLRRLENISVSVELLQRTEIGKEVNAQRKHSSKRVRLLAKKIVRSWKELVDEWVGSAHQLSSDANENDISEMAPEEEGLASPPLDEGALLAARTTSLEVSQFFDFTEDDLSAGSGPSPPTSKTLSNDLGSQRDARQNRTNRLRQYVQDSDIRGGAYVYKTDKPRPSVVPKNDQNSRYITSCGTPALRTSNLANGSNGNEVPSRQDNEYSQQRSNNHLMKRSDGRSTSNLSTKSKLETSRGGHAHKSEHAGDLDVSEKILLTKRKLAEGYQQISEAKKQRTVQALELTDLPKGGPKSAKVTPGNVRGGQNRSWMNGRR